MSSFIPPWVPVLFLVLVFLGYRQSLPRTVKPGTLVALALAMFGLSLYGVIGSFGAEPLALLLWATGYALAVAAGARYFAARGMTLVGSAVHVPGSWVPLLLFLAIFAAKFVLGFLTGVHSPLLHSIGFIAAMSIVLGALSGGFGARAVAVHRCVSAAGAVARTA
ncbi:MAG: hypothetical protein QM722_22805 [Piscinibacter sp.]